MKNGEQKSNTSMQIEDDGPSETFKDEESKVVGVPFQVVFNSISIRLFYS